MGGKRKWGAFELQGIYNSYTDTSWSLLCIVGIPSVIIKLLWYIYWNKTKQWICSGLKKRIEKVNSTVRAPVFGRHQFFGTSEHYRKAHGSLLSGWMNCNYTTCRWFPTSNNILILPSQFWKIRFESCWLHCSKCQILLLQYCSERYM